MSAELVAQIFEICIIPILGAVAVFVVKWVKQKADSLKAQTEDETLQKYIDMMADTVTKCVTATNQTYVDTLKKQGSFDADAQKEAFNKTYNSVLTILSDEAKEYLTEAVGDFETYLTEQIEAEVNNTKKITSTTAE